MGRQHDTIQWFESWTSQLENGSGSDNLRRLHQWIWEDWTRRGASLVASINAALGLVGDDSVQADTPHLFAAKPETARVLFVNINPGWDPDRNRKEEAVVAQSEVASWDFCRGLFTRYPERVGRMTWWSQMIGLAWRIVHGTAPRGISARVKREWANQSVAGWELLPLHSKSAGVLGHLDQPGLGLAIRASMVASLRVALTYGAPLTVVASRVGASMTVELAASRRWNEISLRGQSLPDGSRAFKIQGRLLLAVPRQLASKYSGTKFDDAAKVLRGLQAQASRRAG